MVPLWSDRHKGAPLAYFERALMYVRYGAHKIDESRTVATPQAKGVRDVVVKIVLSGSAARTACVQHRHRYHLTRRMPDREANVAPH